MNNWGIIFSFSNGRKWEILIPFDETLTIKQVIDIIRNEQNTHLPDVQMSMIHGFAIKHIFYGDFGSRFWDLMSIHHNPWEVFVV